MKLIKAHVTNYRSIEDSGEFDINGMLCLVGGDSGAIDHPIPESQTSNSVTV